MKVLIQWEWIGPTSLSLFFEGFLSNPSGPARAAPPVSLVASVIVVVPVSLVGGCDDGGGTVAGVIC
jgi:hypothetical protein